MLLAVSWLVLARGGAQAAPREYGIKAAFLYNFGRFVEWPAEAFATPEAPFSICLFGTDPFGRDIDEVVREGAVQGRPVQVRRTKNPDELRGCQILFIARSEQQRQGAVLAGLGGAPVLTVGETDDFIRAGGALRLFVERNKVRFEINRRVTDRARLKVSSKLLNLARLAD